MTAQIIHGASFFTKYKKPDGDIAVISINGREWLSVIPTTPEEAASINNDAAEIVRRLNAK